MDPIERSRIVERIAAAAASPIALIVAPAGYGKSVALAQYLRADARRSRLFDARPEHATLLGFVRGLCDALGDAVPHARSALAGAHERSRSSATPGADLALWIGAHLRGYDGIIAIDDLHVAQDDPQVMAFLVALIERTKSRLTWILASRSVVALPLATWQAYGDCEVVVDERDLRYTYEEGSQAARAFSIGEPEVRKLLDLTAGWPAAMNFALRSATHSSDLRQVSASTRDMVYGFLAEQVYAGLDDEERALLALGAVLPVLDVRVFERAGFDRALAVLDRLRVRTSFVSCESPGVYRCHDLFRDFLRRQIEGEGRQRVLDVHVWAGRALEESGDIEGALDAYVGGSSHADLVRVLEQSGFMLLERARADAVARALDAASDTARRERPRLLALRGMLAASRGRAGRAETLLRRAIGAAGTDRDLIAIASLRLGIVMANLGRDTLDLLETVAADEAQSASYRAEALSVAVAQGAGKGRDSYTRAASRQALTLLEKVDSEDARAKVLQRLGVAAFAAGDVEDARQFLNEAAQLADEHHFYSISSRSYAALSTLSLYHDDNVDAHFANARRALECAEKAGDIYDRQSGLLRMMHSCIRRGDSEAYKQVEEDYLGLGDRSGSDPYIAAHRGYIAAWEGRLEEALHLLAKSTECLHFDIDKAVVLARCALLAAALSRRDEAVTWIREVSTKLRNVARPGLFSARATAASTMLCSIAEAMNGRVGAAERLAGLIRGQDPAVAAFGRVAVEVVSEVKAPSPDASGCSTINRLREIGYTDVQRFVSSALSCVRERERAAPTRGPLTPSEHTVLLQLAEGLRPKEIASRTGRSVHTIQSHIANLSEKLGGSGRGEAIAIARRAGIIP